ncbi:MAG: 2-hydroxyacid dehydrogenase [Victivallaceae bacterium]|nr:2-hydroxyacid dehydrogenase [Victivallaceae bacterium]
MKIYGIGDLFIPAEYIENGFRKNKLKAQTFDWGIDTFEKLQKINLLIEQKGCEAYEVEDCLLEKIKDAEILITQFCPVNRKVIDNCQNLKIIGVLRGGYENINIDYAASKAIKVFNTPGRNADAVADFTVGAIICEARNIARGHYGIKTGKWIREYSNSGIIPDLPGRTVGLIGFGETGRKTAQRLRGFDMDILVFDPYAKEFPEYVTPVEMNDLMSKADFVSLHARLTEANKHLINAEMLDLMKSNSYLINTSRAGLVDEGALYNALESGKIAGAFLDVFEDEPPGLEHPLVQLDNVTLTPHMAGGSNDAFLNSPVKLATELNKYLRGETCRGIIKL